MPEQKRRRIGGRQGRRGAVVGLLATVIALATGGTSLAADFIGSESCRSCHPDAYAAWVDSPHARAFTRLKQHEREDARCVQCHARDVSSGGEAGVSCETCHGAGEHYWPAYVMRDAELSRAVGLTVPDAKSCLSCHDGSTPSLLPFDVDAAMRAIDHWSASREARESGKAAGSDGRKAQAPTRTGRDELLWTLVRWTKTLVTAG